MEVRDNIMTILKSITPIRYKFSKEYKQLDKAFKSMSLQNKFNEKFRLSSKIKRRICSIA